jgi:hypothetical protein
MIWKASSEVRSVKVLSSFAIASKHTLPELAPTTTIGNTMNEERGRARREERGARHGVNEVACATMVE